MTVAAQTDWDIAGMAAAGSAPAALSVAEWAALANNPLEPTISHDPAWAMTALKTLSPRYPAELFTMSSNFELAGVAVMAKSAWRWGLPIRALTSWSNPHHVHGTPLMSRKLAVEGFSELILRGRPLVFTQMTLDGAVMGALKSAVAATGARLTIATQHERACYRPGSSRDSEILHHLPRKRRKEFRRLRNRLAELGDLQVQRLQKHDDVDEWFKRFEALEVAGWKGRRGTALSQDSADSQLFRGAGRKLHREGRLLFWELSLEQRPIAMMFAMISGNHAWLGKIAYDESLGRFSPGVLVLLDATRDLDQRTELDLVDSCAIPDHPMINNLWDGRMAIGTVIVTPPTMPAWQVRFILALEAGRRKSITMMKSIRKLVTRR